MPAQTAGSLGDAVFNALILGNLIAFFEVMIVRAEPQFRTILLKDSDTKLARANELYDGSVGFLVTSLAPAQLDQMIDLQGAAETKYRDAPADYPDIFLFYAGFSFGVELRMRSEKLGTPLGQVQLQQVFNSREEAERKVHEYVSQGLIAVDDDSDVQLVNDHLKEIDEYWQHFFDQVEQFVAGL